MCLQVNTQANYTVIRHNGGAASPSCESVSEQQFHQQLRSVLRTFA